VNSESLRSHAEVPSGESPQESCLLGSKGKARARYKENERGGKVNAVILDKKGDRGGFMVKKTETEKVASWIPK